MRLRVGDIIFVPGRDASTRLFRERANYSDGNEPTVRERANQKLARSRFPVLKRRINVRQMPFAGTEMLIRQASAHLIT